MGWALATPPKTGDRVGPFAAARWARGDWRWHLLRELRANSLGIESKGKLQARGNGGLVLTKTSLHFFQFLPESELQVPLASVREVSLVRSHLGKTIGYRLLKVRYDTAEGSDSVAWYVPDPEEWQRKLESGRAPAT
jgi:hypothetical protein